MTQLSSPSQRLLSALPEHRHADMAQRLAHHLPVLERHLMQLYGHRPDFAAWFGDLMERIGGHAAARPQPLQGLDAQREQDPDWFCAPTMLGYSAYVDQFGGSLRGVARRIAHLRDLGVTYLHLLPFLRPREGENDGRFAVASFDDVDPVLGTMADLESLAAQLRESGISLCADLVLNHVADDHAWARGARAGDAQLREFFHVFPDRALPDRYERTLGQVFPQAAPGNFTHVAEMGGWVWTTFYPFQWDLNYANPAVLAGMASAMLGLANRGIDVFRLDSAAFLWKREGTNCMNQPEVHLLLQVLRAIAGIAAPGVLLKAEAIVPTRELPAYLGSDEAPECQVAYHSTLMTAGWASLAEQDASLVRAVIERTPAQPSHTSWLTYVRCHDDIGWIHLQDEAGGAERLRAVARFFGEGQSYARGLPFQTGPVGATNGTAAALVGLHDGDPQALRRLLLLHGLALFFGGLPVLYMGDELGTDNDLGFLLRDDRAHDTRWAQRGMFDEFKLAQLQDGTSAAAQVFHGLRRLIHLRRRHPALAAHAPRALVEAGDPSVLALARGEHFLFLANFSSRQIACALPGRAIALTPYAMRCIDPASGADLLVEAH